MAKEPDYICKICGEPDWICAEHYPYHCGNCINLSKFLERNVGDEYFKIEDLKKFIVKIIKNQQESNDNE